MSDVGLAVQRAEDKTAQLQARAGAIDELLASGALDDASGTVKDNITLELDRMSSGSDVENELAAMKAQLAGGSAPKEISGEAPGSAQTAQQPVQQPATQPVTEPVRPQDGDVR
jgi:phage shock protein A